MVEAKILRLDDVKYAGMDIIGSSPVIRLLKEEIKKIAHNEFNVLITGETGVGKELVAKNIHAYSQRSDRKFVDVNCGGMPETLLEAELFGYTSGSFTGADTKGKQGKIELSNGGVLFLDEVGNMSDKGQASLLRAIQTKSVTRIGGELNIRVDFRLITATNVDLEYAIRDGRFREDLYYRINEMRFHIPPLRERKEDIPLIADHFLKIYSGLMDSRKRTFGQEAIEMLCQHEWPGNVRELENVVKRCLAYIRSDDHVIRDHDLRRLLNPTMSNTSRPRTTNINSPDKDQALQEITKIAVEHKISLEELEASYFQEIFKKYGGIPGSIVAGLSKSAFYRHLKRYGIK